MILVGIITADKTEAISVHRGVTVVTNLDPEARAAWATELRKAILGQPSSLVLDVEVDGHRQRLTAEVASRLGLDQSGPDVAILASDVAASTSPAAHPAATGGSSDREATALAAVGQHEADLEAAEQARALAREAHASAAGSADRGAAAAVSAAETRLEAVRSAAETADHDLRQAAQARAVQGAEHARAAASLESLPVEKAELEARRAELLARRTEMGSPGDPKPVEEAAVALRRLRAVEPKASPVASDLVERWLSVRKQLADLPSPAEAPRWLVVPALAALREARAALAEAERGSEPSAVDPELMADLDRAHREVLEAEQKLMKKGSRFHRRRLDQAYAAEQAALARLGVANYGDYLREIAPLSGGPSRDVDRVATARAALADAESVWDELHGGQASPEWTAAKEAEAQVRAEAAAHLGREVDDEDLEGVLRGDMEALVDTEWAERELAGALRGAGVAVDEGADVLAVADAWLAGLPAVRESLANLGRELTEIDGRLEEIEAQLAEHRADLFFGSESGIEGSAGDALQSLEAAAGDAQAAAERAARELAEARQQLASSQDQEQRVATLKADATARDSAVDDARWRLGEAQEALVEVRREASEAAAATAAGPESGVSLEAELYLLARLAALGGHPAGPLPLVVDAGVISGLPAPAAGRLLGLLERVAGARQVLFMGDDGPVARWAEGLGDRAVLRPAAW